MTSKTFSYVGTSVSEGQAKIRFANNIDRVKTLVRHKHTQIEFVQLPEPMTKPDAVAYLMAMDDFAGDRAAVEEANDKYNSPASTRSKQPRASVKKNRPSLEDLQRRAQEAVAVE